jgi:hypothetical protein
VRFFLDNCLSPVQAKALHVLSEPEGHLVRHLSEEFEERNTADEVWLPALSKQGDWVVVSGDLRIFKSPQLRKVWTESKLTTFFLGKGWTNQRFWEQAWWLVRWWPLIVEQSGLVVPGTGFVIPAKSAGKFKPLTSASI